MGKNLLDTVEESVDLRDFLVAFEIEAIEHSDGSFRGCCPVHGGTNMSGFSVYKSPSGRYSWACHTSDCHEEYGANMIGLISGLKKCTIKKSMYLIARKFKIKRDSKGNVTDIKYDKNKVKKSIIRPEEPIRHDLIEKSFLRHCYDRRYATDYFENNNIPEKIIKKFGLGYSGFTKRVTIPILDEEGRLIGFDSRYVDDKYIGTVDVDGFLIGKYKISAGLKKRHVLYGLNMFKKKKKFDYIVLVEGFKDVWLLYLLGIVAVSVFGHTLTQQQLYLIKQRTENVIICFDNDSDDDKNPGQKGAKKVYKTLSQNGINAINICPPSNVDVGNAFTNKEMRKWVEDNIVKTIQGIKNGKK